MNISQAKQIPLRKAVEHLGGRFSHDGRKGETWWFSPFRPDERTASFKIDEKTNKWHDFARTEKLDAHGDILDLWTDFHNLPRKDSHGIKQALQDFKMLSNHIEIPLPQKRTYKRESGPINEPPRYKLVKPPTRIWIDSLKEEVGRRGLTLAIVQRTLKQAYVQDTKTKNFYNGFAFENDEAGYEISIPNPKKYESFKTCIAPKGITSFIPPNCASVLVFEGFWDFYTWMQMKKGDSDHGHIILNSTVNKNKAVMLLKRQKHNIESIFLFMDNDNTGTSATDYLAQELEPLDFTIGCMRHLYEGYKDLNKFWTDSPDALNTAFHLNNRKVIKQKSVPENNVITPQSKIKKYYK